MSNDPHHHHDAAHDWRHAVPPPHPPWPRASRWLRPTAILLGIGFVGYSILSHLEGRRLNRQMLADTEVMKAEILAIESLRQSIEEAESRGFRAEALEAWLEAHPPLQPLLAAVLRPLAQPQVVVTQLTVEPGLDPGALRLAVDFQSSAATARKIFSTIPETLEQVGWRSAPTRQEHDPNTQAAILRADLAPLRNPGSRR